MRNKVHRYMCQERMPEPGSLLLVGVSGGADSVALLHILYSLGYRCEIAHCNFHLRGEESDRDEQFVFELSRSLQLPLHRIDFETEAYAALNKISIEMAARELRYTWFEEIRAQIGAEKIAVAHHRDDNAETLLLNLIRGAGIRGLSGIKPVVGRIIRPLLCLSKTEIIDYIEETQLSYIVDSSNLNDEYTRNKLRLQVIPLLQTINPSIRETLSRSVVYLQEALRVYDASIDSVKDKVFDPEKKTISIAGLLSFSSPESLLFEILSEYGFGTEEVNNVMNALQGQSGKEFYAPDYRLIKDRDFLFLLPRLEQEDESFQVDSDQDVLQTPFPAKIHCEKYKPGFEIDKSGCIAYFDREKLQFPLTIRRWKDGDRFVPFGMTGFQKISDYFNNHKFNRSEKENTWLLCNGEDIIWIINHRTDNRYRLTENTKEVCILELFR